MPVVVNAYGKWDGKDLERAQRDLDKLKAKARLAESAFARMGAATKKWAEKVTGLNGNLQTLAGNVALGVFFKNSIDGALEDAAAFAKLQTAVANTGEEWDRYAGQMNAASAAAIETGYTDEQMTEAMAKVTTMTNSASTAIADQTLIMDLARFTGKSLAESAAMVAKVEEGKLGVISRTLPFIKSTMTSEEALAELRKRVAGQAAAFAESNAGKQAKWNAQLDRFKDTMGAAVLPTLGRLTDSGGELLTMFDKLDKSTKDVTLTWGLAAVVATKLAGGWGALGAAALAYNLTMMKLTQAASRWVVESVGLAGVQDGWNAAVLRTIPALEGLADFQYGAGYSARVLGKDLTANEKITKALAGAQMEYSDALEYTDQLLTPAQSANQRALQDKIAAKAATKALADAIRTYGRNSDEARLAQLDLTEAQNKSDDSAKVAEDASFTAGAAARKAADKWERFAEMVERANKALKATGKSGGAIRIPGTQIPISDSGRIVTSPMVSWLAKDGRPEVVQPLTPSRGAYDLLGYSMNALGVGGGSSFTIAAGAVQINLPANVSPQQGEAAGQAAANAFVTTVVAEMGRL